MKPLLFLKFYAYFYNCTQLPWACLRIVQWSIKEETEESNTGSPLLFPELFNVLWTTMQWNIACQSMKRKENAGGFLRQFLQLLDLLKCQKLNAVSPGSSMKGMATWWTYFIYPRTRTENRNRFSSTRRWKDFHLQKKEMHFLFLKIVPFEAVNCPRFRTTHNSKHYGH